MNERESSPSQSSSLISTDNSFPSSHHSSIVPSMERLTSARKRSHSTEQNDHDSGTARDIDSVTISIDDAIDRVGCGKFQSLILLAAGFCYCADAMEITLLSFLSTVLKSEWNLTATKAASITSCIFMGQLVGTLALGRLGDKIGRRPVFLLAGAIISVFGVGTAFATGYTSLLVMRAIVGFGIGGTTIPYDIVAEFLPVKQRGVWLLYLGYYWSVGAMLVPVIAYFTFGYGRSWNLFVLLCSLPCIASVILGACFVPESPRWLVSQGRRQEALEILRRAARTNGKDFPANLELRSDEASEKSSFGELFKPKWRRLTLQLWTMWFGFGFTYYGVILAVTRVFQDDGDDSNRRMSDMDDTVALADNNAPSFDYASIFVSSSAELLGTFIVVRTVDRLGRVPTQVISYILGGVFMFLLCLGQMTNSYTFLIVTSFAVRVFEKSGPCMTWVSTAELLSTEIRATGHSAANAACRLGAFLCPYLIEGDIPLFVVGWIMLIVHAVLAIVASKLPETKGRNLDEISESRLSNSNHAVTTRLLDSSSAEGYDRTRELDRNKPPYSSMSLSQTDEGSNNVL